jgi:DtxR family transcriptional regulator, Mn-dependent transcriptional regulator
MLSFTEENYLKSLFHLGIGNSEVSVLDLSKSLNIKMPTVNSMIKKLAIKGLVGYEKYKPLSLTASGLTAAGLIIRKHRLVEMYLVEKMGFGWEQVHDIAEQIEHIKSPLFFDKIAEILNNPKVDPHGSPIPDKNGQSPDLNYKKLSDCSINEELVFAAVANSNDNFLKLLSSIDLKLGEKLKIIAIQDFDNSYKINFASGRTEYLSAMVCNNLFVKKID